MNRNFDRSISSSQHSVLIRPITLTFSDDDDDFESHVEGDIDEAATATTEPASQSQSYNSFSTPERLSRTLESSGYSF